MENQEKKDDDLDYLLFSVKNDNIILDIGSLILPVDIDPMELSDS